MARTLGTIRHLGGPAAGALVITVLLSLPLVSLAGGAPVAPLGGAPVVAASNWAFGAERSVSVSGSSGSGNSTYSLTATFGWHTILTQTPVTSTAFQVEANRTAGGSLFVTYCRPDCSSPLATANITVRVWAHELAFANLTQAGTVVTSKGPVAAMALENSDVRIEGNLSETVREVMVSSGMTHLGSARTASASLYVANSGHATMSFTPALGLIPSNLSAASWNSSASYLASGGWSTAYRFSHISMAGLSSSDQGTVPGGFANATGTVQLRGWTIDALHLADGSGVTAVQLQVTGPFMLWEGLIVVPSGADILDSTGSGSWSPYAAGTESATTSAVDVGAPSPTGHVPILATATAYHSVSSDTGTPALTTALSPADGPGTTVVQGQPESVATARSLSQCLLVTCGSGTGAVRPLGGLIVIGAVAVVATLVAVAIVARRQPPRRAPPSPNARLYPPVKAPAPPPATPAPAPPRGPDPDPLGNLW